MSHVGMLPPYPRGQHRELRWSLNTPAGRVPASFNVQSTLDLDAGHAPQVTAKIVVDSMPPALRAALEPSRTPVVLRIEVYSHTTEPLDSLDTTLPGAKLGELDWTLPSTDIKPYVDGAALLAYLAPYAHDLTLWVSDVDHDEDADRTTINLTSFEQLLIRLRNLGGDWQPARTSPRGFSVPSVAAQLLRLLRVPVTVFEYSSGWPIVDEVAPWRHGESAWTWLDNLKARAGVRYLVDPVRNTLRFAEPLDAYAVPDRANSIKTTSKLDLDAGPEEQPYADAYEIEWTWTDANEIEHTQRDLALAPGLSHWTQALRPRIEKREGPPTPLVTAAGRLATAQLSRRHTTTQFNAITKGAFFNLSFAPGTSSSPRNITFTYPEGLVTVEEIEDH